MEKQVTEISASGQFSNNFGTGNISSKLRDRKGSLPGWAQEMSHKRIIITLKWEDMEDYHNQHGKTQKFKNNKIQELVNYINSNSNIRSDITINIDHQMGFRDNRLSTDLQHFRDTSLLGNNFRTLTINFKQRISVWEETSEYKVVSRGGKASEGTDYENWDWVYRLKIRTNYSLIKNTNPKIKINFKDNPFGVKVY